MTPSQIETYVDAAATALTLPLAPLHRPGTLQYFTLAMELAELIGMHPLTPADEPAEAFVPISPATAAPAAAAAGSA